MLIAVVALPTPLLGLKTLIIRIGIPAACAICRIEGDILAHALPMPGDAGIAVEAVGELALPPLDISCGLARSTALCAVAPSERFLSLLGKGERPRSCLSLLMSCSTFWSGSSWEKLAGRAIAPRPSLARALLIALIAWLSPSALRYWGSAEIFDGGFGDVPHQFSADAAWTERPKRPPATSNYAVTFMALLPQIQRRTAR